MTGEVAVAPVTKSAGYDVETLRREEFPWASETVFLNHASIGPVPERVRVALERYGRDRAAAHRITDEHLNLVLDRSRQLAARLINADPVEIALATNTSYGLNLAALMLPLRRGDIVLVSDGEFPANVFPWRKLAERGVVLELVPLTGDGWPDEARILDRLGDPRVRAVAISFVQVHTGSRADLDRLSAVTRASGAFLVVDAIQGIGQIPFDVRATPIDILACGAQKWLLSPWGSGFCYVRRELIEALEPPFAGWTAFAGMDDSTTLCAYPTEWRTDARKFEMITLPFQDFVGMNGAVELLLELGIDAIERHLDRINRPVLDWAARRGVRVSSPVGRSGSGMVCLVPPDPARAYQRLTEAGVVASLREGAVRLSPHCYKTIDELARVTELLDAAV